MDRHAAWIEEAAGRRPDLAPQLAELGQLYHQKLWHQLTERLEALIETPEFLQGGFLVDLYQSFISGFAHKINLLKLASFAAVVAKAMDGPKAGAAFIRDVIANLEASKQPDTEEPVLFLRMQLAQYQLLQGDLAEAKKTLDAGREELGKEDVDPQVSASVYYVATLYHKQQKEYAAFYKAALLYLAYVSSDTLPHDFRMAMAVDVSLAALLGEDVYSFGELLLHPIITVLQGSPYEWLREMLECFNAGDIHAYDALCVRHAGVLNGQPALVEHERRLREKITILCLTELVSGLPAEQRTIPLATIAERTKLPLDGVEFLLMKTLALHLIEGNIDQVDGTVQVSWVQPRVLTLGQVEGLRARLDGWLNKVDGAVLTLEEEAVGVAA